MHILRLNAVPDFEAYSQLGVCEKKKNCTQAHGCRNDEHIQQRLLKALYYSIKSEDKDSLTQSGTLWRPMTYCWHFNKAGMWLASVSCRHFVAPGLKFGAVEQSFFHHSDSVFPSGRAVCSCLRKLNPSMVTQVKHYHTNSLGFSSC